MCKQQPIELRMQQDLSVISQKYNVKILSFQYFKKAFGNIIIEIEKDGDIFTFMSDRGDIFCNRRSSADGLTRTIKSIPHDGYLQGTHIKMIEFINEILNQNA